MRPGLCLPTLDASRARDELGWQPTVTGLDAIGEFLEGLRRVEGEDTPTLRADAGGVARGREFATGVGERDRVESPKEPATGNRDAEDP